MKNFLRKTTVKAHIQQNNGFYFLPAVIWEFLLTRQLFTSYVLLLFSINLINGMNSTRLNSTPLHSALCGYKEIVRINKNVGRKQTKEKQ